MLHRPKSQKIYQEMCESIPGGVNSPVRSCKSMEQIPMVIDRAKGDLLVDVDENTYIDYCGSWGALIHGHAHPVILQSVNSRMQKGTSFGITTSIEGELAKEIISLIDSVEKIRFVSSGTEATMSAIRLARGFTQRDLIIKFSGNYHGHADFLLIEAGSGVLESCPLASSAGIPNEIIKNTICIPYNDLEACRALFAHPDFKEKIAAVILEPIAANMGVVPADQEFVQFLRRETEKIGALLIFDEVITGFRVGLKGAQGIYPVKPDLTCYGKIIGGGFPAAAFGGRREIMDLLAPLGPVYQAGTLSGNPVAMEAGLQSLRMLQRLGFYEELQEKTDFLLDPIKKKIQENGWNICIQQVGSIFTIFFGTQSVKNLKDVQSGNSAMYASFFRALFEKKIYIPPSQYEAWFVSSVHTEQNLKMTRDEIVNYLERNC